MTLEKDEIKSILIIGIAGGLANILAKILSKKYPEAQIVGVDSRPVDHLLAIPGVTTKRIRYSRGSFENLFRDNDFDVVFHLARLSHADITMVNNLPERLDLSVMGTNRILELSLKAQVKKIIILSTFHAYGAYADNPVFLKEDAPLRASIRYPELRDVVEIDRIATNWMWKYQNDIRCIVFRPCNIIGAQIKNAITSYLTSAYTPYPIDYNPMFQFIHEFDMANILSHAIEHVPTGVYNVATDEYISIREALNKIQRTRIPMMISLLASMAHFIKKFGPHIPDYLIDYLEFSCLIDNTEIKKHLGKDFFRFSTDEALELLNLQ